MPFDVQLTQSAIEDLQFFKKHERNQILDEIENQLLYQAIQETRNRKRLRPNPMSEWELRIDKYRVFYDVIEQANQVKIKAVGYKEGNKLFIRGKEYQL